MCIELGSSYSWCYLVRVPVAVEDDHSVGALQVEAKPPGSGAQEEDEVLGLGVIKGFQKHAPVLRFSGPCKQRRGSPCLTSHIASDF